MPQTTRRGAAPLNPQPQWPGRYIAVLREAGAQQKTIPHCVTPETRDEKLLVELLYHFCLDWVIKNPIPLFEKWGFHV
jgi:hypothetical protein